MRQVIVLSTALFVTLVASYVTATSDTDPVDETEVSVYRASRDDITSIVWESEKSSTTMTRRSDENGEFFAVDTVDRVEKKPPAPMKVPEITKENIEDVDPNKVDLDNPDGNADAPEDPHADVEVEVEVTEKSFVGNEQAEAVWSNFAPLKAMRELVIDDSTDTSSFGLEDPQATITVQRGDKTLELTVGAETYGSKDLYVGYANRVYLVDNKFIQPLQFASRRLVEKALHPVAESDATTLELTWADGTARTWTHEEVKPDAEDQKGRVTQLWSSSETDEPDEAAATWVDKLLRMRLANYLSTEDEQALVLTPVFTYTIADEEGSWTVSVLKADDEDGEPTWYAKSPFNRGTVELTASLTRGVVDDLDNLRP